MSKNTNAKILADVYNDIMKININKNDSFKKLQNKFYDVMTKHNIRQGTWSENGKGRLMNNPEWVFCWGAFETRIKTHLMWMSLENPPKHLLAYDKETKK